MIFACPIDGTELNDSLVCEKGHTFRIIDSEIYDFLLKDMKSSELLEKIAPIYERIWAPLGMILTAHMSYSKLLKSIANFINGNIVIDVGTGTGKIFDFINCDKCLGVDISLKFLKYLKKKRSKVIAIRSDASNLPIKSNIADGVSSTLVLHMLPNPSFAIKEISRVLKPNGKCSIVVLANTNSIMGRVLAKWWRINLRHYDYYANLLLSNSLKIIERRDLGPWILINCVKTS
ncbi:class I SAM-dependent methyltransferase [Saccharolobus caldissimus]|uniref:SAM-dependent methyltransferase n=1 Tax=Saccharolobus caldissimus TaxID=1702097 RepID=A0AAQ4CNB2_9CREN|nr:class I SAM-dependent methyltransferase [Saccharolobus caldissimus]BDB97293.1 SAM-dependent methyltransferase [Saccharolobus caldissimus]